MKKVTYIIFIYIIAITVIILSSYEIESIMITKKEVKVYASRNYVESEMEIYKKGENNLPLSGVTFKLKDFNNIYEIEIPETEIPGYYSIYESKEYEYEDLKKIYPEKQQQIFDNLKTKEDVINIIEETGYDYYFVNCYSSYCKIYYTIPFLLEETKVPSGYIKEKYIVPAGTNITIHFYEENIVDKEISVFPSSTKYFKKEKMKDVDNFDYDIRNYAYDQYIINSCSEKRINSTIQFYIDDPIQNCALNLYNQKGIVDVSVKNLVNEKTNLFTTANKILKYQIQIENKGTASSTENTIVSEVPKGLEYVEDSASHDGEYNKEKHQVEWRIDEIESEETIELTYEAIVPKDADPNIKYIGKTSINSREVSEDIKSEETIVSLEKTTITNPKTSNLINFLILIIAGIVILGIYITTYQKKVEPSIKLK